MQNTEKPKFEDKWKSAFDGAEMTPPDRVWSSIELDLAGQESAAMKKRVVFYQRLAAATVVFALMSGGWALYLGMNGGQEKVVSGKETAVTNQEKAVESKVPVQEKNKEIVTQKAYVAENTVSEKETIALAENIALAEIVAEPAVEAVEIEIAPVIEESKTEEPAVEVTVTSPLLLEKPAVEDEAAPDEIVAPKKRSSRENNLWLALGAAAGNYAPNTPSATMNPTGDFAGPALAFASAPQKKPEPKVGSAYSVGMSVGKKFGRIVVQTGVSLAKQQIEYASNYDAPPTTNSQSARAASYDYITAEGSTKALTFTNPYTVNSTMEIVSIPVQAGYMIIDRKLGWQLNAGVSPDFFLRNVLVDESGQRERFTQSAGSESPYRSVNWSGLLNTELSYRIGTHYRLSLVPGVRYSFNSILKDPTDNGRPVILDVGFRFRYLFD